MITMADETDSPAMSESYAVCRRITHKYGANFSVGFRFLPRHKRNGVYAAYAFCRLADDIADDPGTGIDERLDQWQAELDACYAGHPKQVVTVALHDTIQRFPVPKQAFVDLIDGCRQDLVKTRYETFEELLEYCRLVAASISEISLSIFGYGSDSAIGHGRDLSTALQLTNISRDVGDDLDRDRIYIPYEDLERFGVSEADLIARAHTPAMEALLRFQFERARSYFERAEPLIREIERDSRFPVVLMGGVYATVLERLERDPFAVLHRRVSLSTAAKLGVVARRLLRPRFL